MKVSYKEVDLATVIGSIDKTKPLAFDTETIGFYGKIRLAQFYQADWDDVLLVNFPDPMMLTIAVNIAKTVVHNAHYDITTIQEQTETRFIPKDFECTFLLSRLFYYNKLAFSLDDVITYALGFDPYKDYGIDKKALQDSDWTAKFLTEKQKIYASIDVFYLLDVYDIVKAEEESTSYVLDMKTLGYCLDFQWNGMPVITEELEKAYKENIAIIEEYAMPINVNSWKQVRPYIGHNDSDDLALAILSIKGNDKATRVRKIRKIIKQNSFLNKFDTTVGRILGKFKPSARSGRLTSNDQNLQQIPRALKKIFGYLKSAGRILLYSDYAQLEMRSICAITGELRMANLLRAGEDVHDYTARMLFGEDFTKEQRQVAKTANFGLLYGCGVTVFIAILVKLASILLLESEGKSVKYKWRNLWTAIAKWQDEGAIAFRQKAAWITPFGRKYVAKLFTDQLNIKNQGFGSEIAKLALHYMMKDGLPEDVYLINFIHDSFIFDCPDDETVYKPLAVKVAKAMQEAWFEALETGLNIKIRDLPMPVEVFVGYNWGSIEKEYEYKYELDGMHYHKEAA